MVILSIHLWQFGFFEDEAWKFQPGLQVFYGENESGKTTLMDAFQMAFYGSDRRVEDPRLNLRKRYVRGREGESRVQVRFQQGRNILRLDRTFGPSQAKDRLQLIDETDGKEIALARGQEPGDFLFGLDAESFRRTLFVDSSAGAMASSAGNDRLQGKLSKLSAFGREALSLPDISRDLDERKWAIRSKSGRKGRLVDLEADRLALMDKKAAALAREEAAAAERAELEAWKADLKALQATADREKRQDLEGTDQELKDLAAKEEVLADSLNSLEKDRQALVEEKSQKEGELAFIESSLKRTEAPPDSDRLMARYREILEALHETSSPKIGPLVWVFLGLLIVSALLAFFLETVRLLFLALALLCGCLLFYLVRSGKKAADARSKREAALLEEMARLQDRMIDLEKGEGNGPDEARLLEKLEAGQAAIEKLDGKIQDLNRICEEGRAQLERIRSMGQALRERAIRLEAYTGPVGREKALLEKIQEKEAQIQASYGQEERAESLQVKINHLDKKIEGLEEEWQALDLAGRAMRSVQAEEGRKIGPAVQRRALDILKILAPDRFDSLAMDEHFQVSLEDRKDKRFYDWRALSLGTSDQAYFSLRLALVEKLEGEAVWPLFMDDPFVHYDDKRARAGLDFLADEMTSRGRQVFYFTCHGRIRDWTLDREDMTLYTL